MHELTDLAGQVFSDTLKWHARNLVLGVTRNWAKTVVNWNLALDPSGGPHEGGCDTCTGVVSLSSCGASAVDAQVGDRPPLPGSRGLRDAQVPRASFWQVDDRELPLAGARSDG